MGVESNRRAAEALKNGKFKDETVPIKAWKYRKDAGGKRVREEITFSIDDGVRWPTTTADLAKLRPAFKAGGSVTAGNASQMTDGAAFALLMTAEKAMALGLKPLAKMTVFAVAGCAPEEMGMGPSVAIPKALKLAGLKTDDIELFEINEAFASQAIACCRLLGIEERYWKGDINPNGGAIALGHPLGATGAKLTAQILHEAKRRGVKRCMVSMCIGGGMGAAGIYEML
jgi:acetyl-CoA acyltransferase